MSGSGRNCYLPLGCVFNGTQHAVCICNTLMIPFKGSLSASTEANNPVSCGTPFTNWFSPSAVTLAFSLWTCLSFCFSLSPSSLLALYLCLFVICLASGMLAEMPFPCNALSAGLGICRMVNPNGSDCPPPYDSEASRRLVCIFHLVLSHDCALLVSQSLRSAFPIRKPRGHVVGEPHIRTHKRDCFPAKKDL